MLDFTPDVTPNHIRIFDTASSELVAWLGADHVMWSLGFAPGTSLLLVRHEYGELALYDVSARAEVARRRHRWVQGVHPLPRGSLLVVVDRKAEIIRIEAQALAQ